MTTLSFESYYSRSSQSEGISLPVILTSDNEVIELLAKLDIGASHCLFERRVAEILRIDVESGDLKQFLTATGSVQAFGHLVAVEVLEMRFESVVYFFADAEIPRNLLGRVGWLDRVRLGLVEHDHALYLAHYDFDSYS